MKKIVSIILCTILTASIAACKKDTQKVQQPMEEITVADTSIEITEQEITEATVTEFETDETIEKTEPEVIEETEPERTEYNGELGEVKGSIIGEWNMLNESQARRFGEDRFGEPSLSEEWIAEYGEFESGKIIFTEEGTYQIDFNGETIMSGKYELLDEKHIMLDAYDEYTIIQPEHPRHTYIYQLDNGMIADYVETSEYEYYYQDSPDTPEHMDMTQFIHIYSDYDNSSKYNEPQIEIDVYEYD